MDASNNISRLSFQKCITMLNKIMYIACVVEKELRTLRVVMSAKIFT